MVSGVVIAIVSLRALLTLVWFFEVVAGCLALLKGRTPSVAMPGARSHRTAVLIPAHNEGARILPTIRDIQAQLGSNDSILVVADNCTGDTAEIVRAAGVEVTVRTDAARRGKGYALEFGVRPEPQPARRRCHHGCR
jgi:cellulose synthase/poly-beta-1,6-N-acetylglucosamine synthase-like glycosyltransferase